MSVIFTSTIKMDEDEYLQYMIDKRKKELE